MFKYSKLFGHLDFEFVSSLGFRASGFPIFASTKIGLVFPHRYLRFYLTHGFENHRYHD